MKRLTHAYLDIETTGLSKFYDVITVIGIYLRNDTEQRFIQLTGQQVTKDNLIAALEGADTIYTYNGSRFDLPFINDFLGIDLESEFHHHDLMYDCWRNGLYGGFKAVEQQLGIARQLKDIDGFQAVLLWEQYINYDDEDALKVLLEYNREDVLNLKELQDRLAEY